MVSYVLLVSASPTWWVSPGAHTLGRHVQQTAATAQRLLQMQAPGTKQKTRWHHARRLDQAVLDPCSDSSIKTIRSREAQGPARAKQSRNQGLNFMRLVVQTLVKIPERARPNET